MMNWGESWSFVLKSEFTLESVIGINQTVLLINLVFGPSQKKEVKELGTPRPVFGLNWEEWEREKCTGSKRENSINES